MLIRIDVTEFGTYKRENCTHPEHNPPGNMALDPGKYRNTCPSCGQITEFDVPEVTC